MSESPRDDQNESPDLRPTLRSPANPELSSGVRVPPQPVVVLTKEELEESEGKTVTPASPDPQTPASEFFGILAPRKNPVAPGPKPLFRISLDDGRKKKKPHRLP